MRVRVKICGFTEPVALRAAVEAGVDAVGLVLDPSPRQLSLERAKALLLGVPTDVDTVAVVGRPDAARLALTQEVLRPSWIQLMSDAIPRSALGFKLIPAFEDGPDLLERVGAYRERSRQDQPLVLIDGPRPGSGIAADWDRVGALCKDCRLILAGGLTPENVGEAIVLLKPYAVDVSSGVEVERGVKDPDLIRAFLDAVRSASAGVES
jgi:phosphoribosylanthranilate isomerase